jgi:DNA repair photolyase
MAVTLADEDREIRRLTARASHLKDHEVARRAAFKAWKTIREKKRQRAASSAVPLLEFVGETLILPPDVATGNYILRPPLIKSSKLTDVSKGGVGKKLSDGWVINFAIGCTFGCRFCYVDEIHKKFGFNRAGNIVYNEWGSYFAVPLDFEKLIEQTQWEKWKGEEVMLSSTHDAFLPQLHKSARKILESALPAGVKFCIQTRSPLVEQHFDLLSNYKKQVRLQVSIATMNNALSRLIEPRVVPPMRRVEVLRKAKESGLTTGVIIAPVFPPVRARLNVEEDLSEIAKALEVISPAYIYGESLHVRGINLAYVEKALGERISVNATFDKNAERSFDNALAKHGMKGKWWREF